MVLTLTKIIININNYSVKTAILYPLSPYLIDLFAPTVSLAHVEVANVASPRRRDPADNICHGPRATLIRQWLTHATCHSD